MKNKTNKPDSWLEAAMDGRFTKALRARKIDPITIKYPLVEIIMGRTIVDAMNPYPTSKKISPSDIDAVIDQALKEGRDPFLSGIDYVTEERKKKRKSKP